MTEIQLTLKYDNAVLQYWSKILKSYFNKPLITKRLIFYTF
jgi:hypothetical protein